MTRVIESLEELRSLEGQEAGVSEWHTVTQEMIDRFADLTNDRQWIHVDVARAQRESRFGSTVAHGFLTLSLLSQMMHQAVEIRGDFQMLINYGFNRVRFVSPVPTNSRIRARLGVKNVTENEVIWDVTVELEGAAKPAIVAEWLERFY